MKPKAKFAKCVKYNVRVVMANQKTVLVVINLILDKIYHNKLMIALAL